MSERQHGVEERLASMRLEFDRGFAEPTVMPGDDREALLRLIVGDAAYAVRLREIDGLFVDRPLLAVPSPLPELLGLSSIRGRLVPVYALDALLSAQTVTNRRWFVVTEGGAAALAFDGLGGYARARPIDLLVSEGGQGSLCPQTLFMDDATLGVISIPSVVRMIEGRVAARRPG